MSKGLRALEEIRECDVGYRLEMFKHNCKIIEKELKEYEETKKDLKQVMKDYQDLGNSCYKKLKALDIIKNKKVNVPSLITLFKSNTTYEDYEQLWENDIRWQLTKNWDIQFSKFKLTEEEYDLLKEVLL